MPDGLRCECSLPGRGVHILKKRPISEVIPIWVAFPTVCMVCLAWLISVQNTGRARPPIDTSGGRGGARRLFAQYRTPSLSVARETDRVTRRRPIADFREVDSIPFPGRTISISFPHPHQHRPPNRPQSGENEGESTRPRVWKQPCRDVYAVTSMVFPY